MKLIAYLLMTACLILGAISATTAYSPTLGESAIGLTLNADAGMLVSGEPLATQDDVITRELLDTLLAAGVERVRVKEFSFERWDHWWTMLAACAGLVIAALMVKMETRRRIAAKLAASDEPTESPEHALAEIRAVLDSLERDLPSMEGDEKRIEAIIERLGGLQWTHLQAIVDARPTLIARLRLVGFAEFMDRFSAFERQLNRAWSAAADEALEASLSALDGARAVLPQVEAKLNSP